MRVQPINIRTKSVYEPAEPSDGRRVLVTQYWPRGISKSAVDEYVRALAPSRELLRDFRERGLNWDAFRERYLELMGTPEARTQIQLLAQRASTQPLTLMCVCRDERICHRRALLDLILSSALGRRSDGSGRP